jgi:SOS-response transcriptional repressor LexA
MTLTTSIGRYAVLSVAPAGEPERPAGVLLEDPESDRLYLRLRRDWDEIAPEEADVLEELASDLESKATEMGAAGLLDWLERNASNFIRVTGREQVLVGDFEKTLARLYNRRVPATVRASTHVPLYRVEAAAGGFLPNIDDVEERAGWIELPPEVRGREDYFAAQVIGRSMLPRIPDGAICLFRRFGAGSRQGKLVLVREAQAGGGQAFTVKKYKSVKALSEDTGDEWAHTAIELLPLNPEFPVLRLSAEEEHRVVAEFVDVLEDPEIPLPGEWQ